MTLEFGVQIEPQFGYEFKDVLEITESAIENGFTTIWFSDHFMLNADATDRVLLDPWLLMTALIMKNPDIRVGSLVFCNSYRNPALHAKMGATLDVLSNGRFEFGIGAGWKKLEYEAYGYEFPDDLIRIEQLAEAVQIIRSAWTKEKISFEGRHYNATNLISFPKPIQKPHPRIWIGTMEGRDRMLEVAAKYGDGVNLAWSFTPEDLKPILSQLHGICRNNNRDSETLHKSVGLWTCYFQSEKDMENKIAENAAERGISIDQYRERVSSALWGTSDMMVEKLKGYEEIGVSHIILMFPHKQEKEQLANFGKSVLPKL